MSLYSKQEPEFYENLFFILDISVNSVKTINYIYFEDVFQDFVYKHALKTDIFSELLSLEM